MSASPKFSHGTMAWFEMVGTLMCAATARAGLAPNLNWSLVERYVDGATLPDGRIQGIRFDIVNGAPAFRIGVDKDERGDVTIEVCAAAARELNLLYAADPAYEAFRDRAIRQGRIRVDGDLGAMAHWLAALHDPIVDHTS